MSGGAKLYVRVAEVVRVNDLITRFRFVARDGGLLPAFSGGAHTVVEMDDHGTRRLNPYSLMSDPEDRTGYEISVRRDDAGRGGSLFMHNHVKAGMDMVLSHPMNLFALDNRARKHVFFAGGIGITPFLAMMHQLSRFSGRFELHYAARNPALCAYGESIKAAYGEKAHLYFDDLGQQMPLADILARQPIGTHIYCCGPKGMLNWVRSTALAAGLPQNAVHFEEFTSPGTGAPFAVELAASGKTITVGPTQSLLEAMEAAGVDAPYMCRGGACGQCETNVISCDGQIDHRDHWLSEQEQRDSTKIMPCVSRFSGRTLVIDR
jgi:dimethylamine monooxygenase subunit B